MSVNLDIFKMMSSKLGWLSERQGVLAQNIANADTPGYRPFEVEPYSFEKVMAQSMGQTSSSGTLQMASTSSGGMTINTQSPSVSGSTNFAIKADPAPYEINPNGNGVVLEQQMVKASQNATNYQLMTSLYSQTVALFKTAIKTS